MNYSADMNRLDLAFEFLDMDLRKYIYKFKQNINLTGLEIKKIMYQMINAIAHCHSRRIIHRDIKPNNILITKDGETVKLADFGLSRTFKLRMDTMTNEIETLWYRAPEILLGSKNYSLGVDSWGVGCIFVELVERRPMFEGKSDI